MSSKKLPEERRKEIFLAVVEAEDRGEHPRDVRQLIAQQFDITEEDVASIAEEGLDKTWPPLEPCDDE